MKGNQKPEPNKPEVEEVEVITDQTQPVTVEVPLETTVSTEESPKESTETEATDAPVEPAEPVPTEEETETQPASESTNEETKTEEGQPTSEEELGMYTARSEETGDKVYLVRQGKRYWVKNPETLSKMGFYLGKEKKIPFSELLQFPEGEPVDLTVPDAIYPWDKPESEEEVETPYKVWN